MITVGSKVTVSKQVAYEYSCMVSTSSGGVAEIGVYSLYYQGGLEHDVLFSMGD